MNSGPPLKCALLVPMRRSLERSDGALHSESAWFWLYDCLFEHDIGVSAITMEHRRGEFYRKMLLSIPAGRMEDFRETMQQTFARLFLQTVYLITDDGEEDFGLTDDPC